MSQQKSWWYQTEHFWTDYPSPILPANLKAYYLLQFAYWCVCVCRDKFCPVANTALGRRLQETFVILAGMEKPRADNTQMWVLGSAPRARGTPTDDSIPTHRTFHVSSPCCGSGVSDAQGEEANALRSTSLRSGSSRRATWGIWSRSVSRSLYQVSVCCPLSAATC